MRYHALRAVLTTTCHVHTHSSFFFIFFFDRADEAEKVDSPSCVVWKVGKLDANKCKHRIGLEQRVFTYIHVTSFILCLIVFLFLSQYI